MQRSESIAALAAALAKAQAQVRGAVKDSVNPHFKNRYADLASVWDACRAALTANGIAVVQGVDAEGPVVKVETMLLHSSGEWMSSTLPLPAMQNTAQGIGGAITYGRRYGLAAMVGIAQEDDDGNAASAGGESRPANGHAAADTIRAAATDPASRKAACFAKLARIGVEGKALRAFVGGATGIAVPPNGEISLGGSAEALAKLEAATEKAEADHNAAEALAKAQNRSVA